MKVLALLVIALMLVFTMFILLLLIENKPYLPLLFETVSAFATVGVSMGITPELSINGNPAIKLFGSAGTSANDSKSTDVTFSTPASYWRDGNNTLLFKHTRTSGFVINNVMVQFDVGASNIQSGSGSVNMDWAAPSERADNTALSLSEIAGYTIYYGDSAGNYTQSLSVNDGLATSVIINSLPLGTYYMVVTARDYDGRESKYSDVVTVEAR